MDFYTYKDQYIKIDVPDYMKKAKLAKPQNAIAIYFDGTKPQQRRQAYGIFGIAVEEIVEEESLRAIEFEIIEQRIFDEWMGTQNTIIRRGKIQKYSKIGIERFVTSSNKITGDVLHDYIILFVENERHVYIHIFGRGQVSEFDQDCKMIVESAVVL